MTNQIMLELPALKLAGTIAAVVFGTGSFAMVADAMVSESTPISLGLIVGASVGVCGGIWFLGRMLQKLEDGQREMKSQIKEIKVKLKIHKDEDTDL